MTESPAEAPLWMPDLGDMPAGPARVLIWLVVWRDGRGSCDPTNAELCKVTKLDESTVRKHTGWLASNGWVKRERRAREDGSLGVWRYWLDLEKLGLGRGEGGKSGGRPARVSPSENSDEARAGSRAGNLEVPPESEGGKQGGKYGGAQNIEGGKSAGLVRERGRARARLSLYSIPPSFAFRDERQRFFMEGIIAVCGIGLESPERADGLIDSLADVQDDWLARFDYALDIIPCVKQQTGYPRAKSVTSFRLFDLPGKSDLEAFREARLAREAAKLAKASGVKPFAVKGGRGVAGAAPPPPANDPARRASRMEALRRTIASIDSGTCPVILLPPEERGLSGEWLDDAFARERARCVGELAALEADGGGDGHGG